MKFDRRIHTGIIILSSMVLFTSCGKTKKDTIADDLKENVGVEASIGDAGKQNETDEIPENISYTVEVGGRTSKVDAKIYADGYGNVPTLAVKECEDREEWVSKYAAKLFDDGEYTNVKPYEVLSREELEKELQFFKEQYSGNGEDVWNSDDKTFHIESLLENYNEENYVKYPDDKLVYSQANTTYYEGEEFSSTSNEANLRGYVDGRMWSLRYADGEDEYTMEGKPMHNQWAPCIEAHCIDEIYNVYNTSNIDETYLNNVCNREDAEKQAKEFLRKLGFDNMELLHIVQNNLAEVTEDTLPVDGYTMIFGMSNNGTHLLFGTGVGQTSMDPEREYGAVMPYVEVIVNSNGVYGVTIRGRYNEPEIMSEKSTMLSFEQINEIAKEKLADTMTEWPTYYVTIDTIEFGYMYITYDGLSYAVVPVWCYYSDDRNAIFRSVYLAICALDGAEIYAGNTNTYYGAGTIPY
ncbi:MAG: hypothetical protein K2G45_08885 [Lachnospiraceae bacterium]|nr:hypothetical protein [Lachnospiraceae bacterium]